jgi:hypothetical protein
MLADLGPREIVLTHRKGLLVYANGQYYEEGFFPLKGVLIRLKSLSAGYTGVNKGKSCIYHPQKALPKK